MLNRIGLDIYESSNCIPSNYLTYETSDGRFTQQFNISGDLTSDLELFAPTNERTYYLFKSGIIFSKISAIGMIIMCQEEGVEAKNAEMDEDRCTFYNYRGKKLLFKGIRSQHIYYDGKPAAVITFGGKPIRWLFDCIKNKKILKYDNWRGIEFNENSLDAGTAVTLFLSRALLKNF